MLGVAALGRWPITISSMRASKSSSALAKRVHHCQRVRDAYIIAEAARSMPHMLHSLKLLDNEVTELTMLFGFMMTCRTDHSNQATVFAAY